MKLQQNKTTLLALLYGLISTFSFIGCGQIFESDSVSSSEREFQSLYNLLDRLYLYADEELKIASTYKNDITSLMDDIQDPYTEYFNPIEAKALLSQLTTPEIIKLVGIQTQISTFSSKDSLEIKRVFRESPAEKAGLLPGDFIEKINGTAMDTTLAKINEQFTVLIANDTLEFQIRRQDTVFTTSLIKKEIVVPTVFTDPIEDGISLIQITGFSDYTFTTPDSKNLVAPNRYGTYDEFLLAIEQTQNDIATLIDLRSNPGGSIDQCVNIASEFLNKGDTIIIIEDHTQETMTNGSFDQYITAFTQGVANNRKFVFLGDAYSASCSEILLSAIKDNTDFKLVGTQTYGKGIGQSFSYTYERGIAKITSLGIYAKDHSSYHQLGIKPDIENSFPTEQLALALTEARSYFPALKSYFIRRAKAADIQLRIDQAPKVKFIDGAFFNNAN